MKEILFRGKRTENGEEVIGCLINNMFYKAVDFKNEHNEPIPYIIPNNIDYDCWEDIAEIADMYRVIPETVEQITFLSK